MCFEWLILNFFEQGTFDTKKHLRKKGVFLFSFDCIAMRAKRILLFAYLQR